jgi:hypothetical protein
VEQYSRIVSRPIDARAAAADRLNHLTGCLVVPDIGILDDHPLLTSDLVLPSQRDRRWRNTKDEDWRRLCSAVLLGSAECLQRPLAGIPSTAPRREALAWFERPDMPVTLNLRTCCLALDLDVAMVQMAGRRLAREQVLRRRRHTPS